MALKRINKVRDKSVIFALLVAWHPLNPKLIQTIPYFLVTFPWNWLHMTRCKYLIMTTYLTALRFTNTFQSWWHGRMRRNWQIFKKTHRQIAVLDLSVMICFSGKPQSWDHRTVHILEEYIFSIFIFQQIIHSRWELCVDLHLTPEMISIYIFSYSLQSFNLLPAYIIRTSMRMEASVWISWRISGAPPLRFRKCSFLSLRCLPTLTQVSFPFFFLHFSSY